MNDQIGPYKIVREIGRGGMGVVHLARDTRPDRDVAIKELPERFAQDPVRLERFERDAKARAGARDLGATRRVGRHGWRERYRSHAGRRIIKLRDTSQGAGDVPNMRLILNWGLPELVAAHQ